MDIKKMALEMLVNRMGGNVDTGNAESALDDLVGMGDKFDIGDLVGQFTSSGGEIADKAKSWLGDGGNEAISADQITDILGAGKVKDFAAKLGIGADEAGRGLSDFLPQLIDKSSVGGKILGASGAASGLANLLSKVFK